MIKRTNFAYSGLRKKREKKDPKDVSVDIMGYKADSRWQYTDSSELLSSYKPEQRWKLRALGHTSQVPQAARSRILPKPNWSEATEYV
jgi:hypothetical protein